VRLSRAFFALFGEILGTAYRNKRTVSHNNMYCTNVKPIGGHKAKSQRHLMLDYYFQQSLGDWVGSAVRTIERALNDVLVPHGITLCQVQVLAQLVDSMGGGS
jgi:hypothetical protein